MIQKGTDPNCIIVKKFKTFCAFKKVVYICDINLISKQHQNNNDYGNKGI